MLDKGQKLKHSLVSFDDFQSIDLGVKKGLTYDEAIERAGGFGKQLLRCFILLHDLIGLFHVYAILFFTLAMTTNGYLTYSIPFLELYPDYVCPEETPNCGHKDRC